VIEVILCLEVRILNFTGSEIDPHRHGGLPLIAATLLEEPEDGRG
jgi:hypothetical protein